MASIMEIIMRAIDQVSPVVNKIQSETDKANAAMQKGWTTTGKSLQAVGIATTALGAGIEMLARSNAPLVEMTGRLADNLGITDKAMRDLVISTSNVTLPLDEVLSLMELGTKEGLNSAEALKKYAEFWDMVGDATGESAIALADSGIALKALGISAGEEGQALSAFGFIQKNTTMQLNEFISMVGRLGPQMRAMNLDINDAAVIMGILQQEFGETARVSIAEFRRAVTESGGDMEKLKTTLGITSDMWEKYTGKLKESSTVIKENSDRHEALATNMQKLQHWLSELKYGFSETITKAAEFAPLLTGLGSAMTLFGTLMKTQLYANLMLSIQGIQAMGISVLGLAANYAMAGVALAIWVKVYQGVVQVIKDAKAIREAEAASVIAQAEANDKLQKAYNLTSEEMIKVNQNMKDHKPLLDGIRESTDTVTTSTTNLGTSAGETTPKVEGLGTAIEGVGIKAEGLPTKLDGIGASVDDLGRKIDSATGQWAESEDTWFDRIDAANTAMYASLAEGEKKVADTLKETANKAKEVLDTYANAMGPIKERIEELTHTEEQYAIIQLNTIDALDKKRKATEDTVIALELSNEKEKAAMGDIALWYQEEIDAMVAKLREKRDEIEKTIKALELSPEEEKKKLAEVSLIYEEEIAKIIKTLKDKELAVIKDAKQVGLSAEQEKILIANITSAYDAQIAKVKAVATATEASASRQVAAINKIVNAQGKVTGVKITSSGKTTGIISNEPITGELNTQSADSYEEAQAIVAANQAKVTTPVSTPSAVINPPTAGSGYIQSGDKIITFAEGTPLVTKSGLVIVDKGEAVLTPEQNKAYQSEKNLSLSNTEKTNQIYLTIQEGAFKISANKLDEGTIRNAGKLLFEEIFDQFRAHNIQFAKG
jgi:hypothetical protein